MMGTTGRGEGEDGAGVGADDGEEGVETEGAFRLSDGADATGDEGVEEGDADDGVERGGGVTGGGTTAGAASPPVLVSTAADAGAGAGAGAMGAGAGGGEGAGAACLVARDLERLSSDCSKRVS
jgi:hypothetical protein